MYIRTCTSSSTALFSDFSLSTTLHSYNYCIVVYKILIVILLPFLSHLKAYEILSHCLKEFGISCRDGSHQQPLEIKGWPFLQAVLLIEYINLCKELEYHEVVIRCVCVCLSVCVSVCLSV